MTYNKQSDNSIGVWKSVIPYIPGGGSLIAGQWYTIRMTLSDLGAPLNAYIKGIYFMTSGPTTVYVENVGIVPSFLKFPLAGKDPYTMRVVAVQDHSNALNLVRAYNGEIGEGTPINYNGNASIRGYTRKDKVGLPFELPLIQGYDEEYPNPGLKNYLWYDNHKGYDYADSTLVSGVTKILAADAGYLCIANNVTSNPNNNTYWRAPVCTILSEQKTSSLNTYNGSTQWDTYHAVYIVHPNGYSSWYLHGNLLSTIDTQIKANGFVAVIKGHEIATVGDKGVAGNTHLHFGVKDSAGKAETADPYGDESTGSLAVLWELIPN